jgi:hypothetical protein
MSWPMQAHQMVSVSFHCKCGTVTTKTIKELNKLDGIRCGCGGVTDLLVGDGARIVMKLHHACEIIELERTAERKSAPNHP